MSLSTVIDVAQYENAAWMDIHRELESYATDKHVFRHTGGEVYRKGWEWTQALYGLHSLGAIHDEALGLGVGAGREAIIFYLADRCRYVVATDLYGNAAWSTLGGQEASAEILQDATPFCPRPFASAHVTFENADGTHLPYADGAFDFCWSLSSIEHFGGHDASAQAVREMARVVKTGGVICLATEYILLPSQSNGEFFNHAEFIHYIVEASPDLAVIDGIDWTLPPVEYLIDQIRFDGQGVHRLRRHVVMNDGAVQWTSIMVFLRKIR